MSYSTSAKGNVGARLIAKAPRHKPQATSDQLSIPTNVRDKQDGIQDLVQLFMIHDCHDFFSNTFCQFSQSL